MARPLNTFDFITDDNERIMYDTALRAITELRIMEFYARFSGQKFSVF
jgi:hypothetical protein